VRTGDDERGEGTEDWFEDVAGEPRTGFRDPDAETWLEEPERAAEPRDRRQLIAALAAVVALVVVGVGLARVVSGGEDKTSATTTTPTAQTETGATGQTQTATTSALAVPEDVTLKSGDEGASAKKLQRALNALGYDVGKADGVFGPATVEAVKKFQADSGLDADGVAGQETLSALNDALASK
jgi:murein L,D-transpeptidase YcbB/YkuD